MFMRDRLKEGNHESRRFSKDTYPESYITKYTSKRGTRRAPRAQQRDRGRVPPIALISHTVLIKGF